MEAYKLKNLRLKELGWQDFFKEQYEETNLEIARVVLQRNNLYRIINENGEYDAEVTGKFSFEATTKKDFPVVGDWVLIANQSSLEEKGTNLFNARIHKVLKRKSAFIRQSAGIKLEEQVVASNIDFVFLVNALNQDFNIRRIERYLLTAYESGSTPIIILTKRDLCDNPIEKIKQIENITFGKVKIITINNLNGDGLEEVKELIQVGSTIALIGSSGVGKSTLLNTLMGQELQKVSSIREEDSKGKHTTTHRELFMLPNGGLVIDTPGMRELQLYSGSNSIDETFSDIEDLIVQCKFSNCTHKNEPHCKIIEALNNGILDEGRYKSYKKIKKELKFQEKRNKESVKLKYKKISKRKNQN